MRSFVVNALMSHTKVMLETAEIVAPPGAPLPDALLGRIEAQFITTEDGTKLRFLLARPDSPETRGTIIIVPGRTEFSEKYSETIVDFLDRNFTVCVIDHRGQGLSSRPLEDGMKSHIEDFQLYADDLGYIIDSLAKKLPKPQILVAHSMGGCIALQSVLSGTTNPSAIICTAPMLGLFDVAGIPNKIIVKILTMIGLAKRSVPYQKQKRGLPQPFKYNKLTSDKERYARWAAFFTNVPRLRVAGPTFGWMSAALKAMSFVNRNASKIKTPTLIVAAGGDPIVDPSSNSKFARKAGARYAVVPGALHELFLEQEPHRKQLFAEIDRFLTDNAF